VTTVQGDRPATVMGRAVSARARALADSLSLEESTAVAVGEIDLTTPEALDVPEHVQAAAAAALDRGETHYTTRPGVVPLREAIAERLTADGFPASAETVLVTNGGAEALYIALQMLLAQSRRMVVAGPVPANVAAMIRFIGAEPVLLPTGVESRFYPSVHAVTAAEGSSLLLSSPSPVTGLALSPSEQEALIAKSIERGMMVVLDRSLATALYDPALARFGNPELGANLVRIGSFSAGYGLVGWRVGWLSAPPETMKLFSELKQAMSICTTAVSQFAALSVLDGPADWVELRRVDFIRRRDEAMGRLRTTPLVPVEPDAYPALIVDVRAVDTDDRGFAARLRAEMGVIVAAGSTFGPGTAGFVRLDLSAPAATVAAGIERMASFAERGTVQ
jgi:aspartate/methionine/tyrosine aminotransferase